MIVDELGQEHKHRCVNCDAKYSTYGELRPSTTYICHCGQEQHPYDASINKMEKLMNDMLLETDKLALLKFAVMSPEYDLQWSLIRNAARYRIAKYEEDNE